MWPVSVLFGVLTQTRHAMFKAGLLRSNSFTVPVIVVGNISVGGTGKTPLVSALVKRLQAAGLKPGIVSRGYGAQKALTPRMIDLQTPVALAGDEPALLARETGVPVCVCVNRSAAVQALIDEQHVNAIVSDDGLQHYAMQRDMEIAVVDGQRGFGNGFLLPAGPLREPVARLKTVQLIAVQRTATTMSSSNRELLASVLVPGKAHPPEGNFFLQLSHLRNLSDDQHIDLASFQGQQVHAVAGLGNPNRFFESLRANGLQFEEHRFPDHHHYAVSELAFDPHAPVVVTGKDAVKISELDMDLRRFYEVVVVADMNNSLNTAIDQLIATCK